MNTGTSLTLKEATSSLPLLAQEAVDPEDIRGVLLLPGAHTIEAAEGGVETVEEVGSV
jgi:hypothetical protein